MSTVANGMAVTTPPLTLQKPPEEDVAPAPSKHIPFLSRQQILDATLSCLLESGYDGTTIRRIAKHLGCAVGSIYRYFTDKRELLDAVTSRRFEPVAESIEAGASIQEGFGAYARTAVDQPELYRLMFWLHSVGNTTEAKLPPIIDRMITAWSAKLGDRRTAERLWALLHGGIMLGRGSDYAADVHLLASDKPTTLEPVIVQTAAPAPAGKT